MTNIYNINDRPIDFIDEIKLYTDNHYSNKDKTLMTLDAVSSNDEFFNLVQLYFIEHIAPECLDKYKASRERFQKKGDEIKELELKKKEKEKEHEKNKMIYEYNLNIKLVEQKIISQQNFYNFDIRDSRGVDRKIILELFKKYDIDIPKRTVGWINDRLHEIKFIDGCITYSYSSYKRSDSKVFLRYLMQLQIAVNKNKDN